MRYGNTTNPRMQGIWFLDSNPTYEVWKLASSITDSVMEGNTPILPMRYGNSASGHKYSSDSTYSNPTYEVWKHWFPEAINPRQRTPILPMRYGNLPHLLCACRYPSGLQSYLWGMETPHRDQCLLHYFLTPILPMRYGNYNILATPKKTTDYSNPTYEVWKLSWEDWEAQLFSWTPILPMRYGNYNRELSKPIKSYDSNPTYEVWKLKIAV